MRTWHSTATNSLRCNIAMKRHPTHEIQSNISAPKRLRVEKRGEYVYVMLGGENGELQPSGASMRIAIHGPNAERACDCVLSLPLFPSMTTEQVS